MSEDPAVSIIIVNWNGKHYLPACLSSVRGQTLEDFEVIMVDNGSSDGSIDFVQEHFPEVIVVASPVNLGFAEGNNLGFEQARGKYVALLNNDTECDARWLEELVRVLESSERIAGVCATMHSLDDKERVLFTLTKIDPLSAKAYWINQPSEQRDVDYVIGSATVLRRSVIDQIGSLDKEYFAYYEETDWCARAIRAGYRLVYVPTAIYYHQERGTAAETYRYYMMWRNRIRFALKNFDVFFLLLFPAFCALDMCRQVAFNLGHSQKELNLLILRAICYNIVRLPSTIAARWRDLGRIRARRSYNRSLPLREIKSDGNGGFKSAEGAETVI
jgi:GT2 family glycosyltransferase